MKRISVLILVTLCLMASNTTSAFCPAPISSRRTNGFISSRTFEYTDSKTKAPKRRQSSKSSLNMFMGSDGGILGVGAPEVFTILVVGYFILGPSDLYKVVKEIGKFVENFRTLSSDLTKTVESNLESQLEIEEIRKAQRELTDAFSFRRTINVDQDEDPFSTTTTAKDEVSEDEAAENAAATAMAATPGTKKKKIRRRMKKKVVEPEPPQVAPVTEQTQVELSPAVSGAVEDLDMTQAFEERDEAAEQLRQERMERLTQASEEGEQPDWFQPDSPDYDNEYSTTSSSQAEEQERFAAQMSEGWNESILQNEDKLSPLSKVMERLAILEEEKQAADARLEEEFRLRSELEEKYYKEKRNLLEEAAAQVQADAYTSSPEKENTQDQVQTTEASSSNATNSNTNTTIQA